MKHLQIMVKDDHYALIKLVSIRDDATLKEVLEKAVEAYCLKELEESPFEGALEFVNQHRDKEKEE